MITPSPPAGPIDPGAWTLSGLEQVARIVAVLTVLTYVIGFLIVTEHDAWFGILAGGFAPRARSFSRGAFHDSQRRPSLRSRPGSEQSSCHKSSTGSARTERRKGRVSKMGSTCAFN